MEILPIVGFATGFLLIAMAARHMFAKQPEREWSGLIGEMTSHNGPVTICRVIGSHGNGEPVVTNRSPSEDSSMPWSTRRNEESANQFFEWEWKDRTEDDPGDAYYNPRPARWFQCQKLSSRSNGDTDRKYERK